MVIPWYIKVNTTEAYFFVKTTRTVSAIYFFCLFIHRESIEHGRISWGEKKHGETGVKKTLKVSMMGICSLSFE